MYPCPKMKNSIDCAKADTQFFRNQAHNEPLLPQLPYARNVMGMQFRFPIRFSFRMLSSIPRHGILHILLLRAWINMHAVATGWNITMMAGPKVVWHGLIIQNFPCKTIDKFARPTVPFFGSKPPIAIRITCPLPWPTAKNTVYAMLAYLYPRPKAFYKRCLSYSVFSKTGSGTEFSFLGSNPRLYCFKLPMTPGIKTDDSDSLHETSMLTCWRAVLTETFGGFTSKNRKNFPTRITDGLNMSLHRLHDPSTGHGTIFSRTFCYPILWNKENLPARRVLTGHFNRHSRTLPTGVWSRVRQSVVQQPARERVFRSYLSYTTQKYTRNVSQMLGLSGRGA